MHDTLSNEQLMNSYNVTASLDSEGDQVDRANFEYDRNQSIILKNRDAVQLKSLRKAPTLLTNNPEDFGWCESCGVDISFARLIIRPASCFCLECMRVIELKDKSNRVAMCIG